MAIGVETAAGFGATVVTVTFAAQLMPVEDVLAVFLPMNLLLAAWIVGTRWALVDRRLLLHRVLPGMGAGMLLGFGLADVLGQTLLKAAFGLFVVGLSVLELRRSVNAAPTSRWVGGGALLVAGLIHGLFACGGPLLVWVVGRDLPEKGRFRVTLQAVWLVLGLGLLVRYAVAGTLGLVSLRTSAALVPALVLGLAAGEWVHRRVPPARFRLGVYWLLFFAGGSLAARTGLELFREA